MAEYQYIENNQALAEFCQQIAACSYCALDTEFVREKTYFPLLALIQLATETRQACVDPLSITDFSPLVSLFENEGILKILHAPSQDLELFHHDFGALPKPVFDTQLAAAVLGYANQIGYADLVHRLCRVQLDKKHTRANWSKRPLSDGELNYAMDDVRYLIEIQQKLAADLESRGRQGWVKADFDALSDPESYRLNKSELWKRLKGVQKLKGAALNNADQLCRWREQVAIEKNRPRRWILKDEDIVDIARFNPANQQELSQIGDLGKEFIRKNADKILRVLADAGKIDPRNYPRQEQIIKLSNKQQAQADCLMAICREVTERNEIALSSVATKKDIDLFVLGSRDTRLSRGWRYEMLGKYLSAFLEGELSLSCGKKGIDF